MAIWHRMTVVCTNVCLSAFFPEKLERALEDPEVSPCKRWKNCILLCCSCFDHYLQSVQTEYNKSDEVSRELGVESTNEQRTKEFNSKQQELTVTFSKSKANNLML